MAAASGPTSELQARIEKLERMLASRDKEIST
jgi:hypothetical protein